MKKTNSAKLFFLSLLLLSLCQIKISAQNSLDIGTEYNLTGIMPKYNSLALPNNNSYYNQRLILAIKATAFPKIEICTKLQAVGVVGSTNSLSVFFWQTQYPYPNVLFNPFVENIYIKVADLDFYPIDITIGRQPLEYGSGLIVSDNNAGMNALKFAVNYPLDLHTEFFTAKIVESFCPNKDFDLNGLVFRYPFAGYNGEFGYFEEKNYSGSDYQRGTTFKPSTSILKNFIDLRFSKPGKLLSYSMEYAFQKGSANLADSTKVDLDGKAFLAEGSLTTEKLISPGKITASGILAVSSGDKGKADSANNDQSFVPYFTKRFNGLMRKGWGNFFSSSIYDNYFDMSMDRNGTNINYSGVGVLGLGCEMSMKSGWSFGLNGYSYSSSEFYASDLTSIGAVPKSDTVFDKVMNVPIGNPESRYSMGNEIDISTTYEYWKSLAFRVSYSRYFPPYFEGVWAKGSYADLFMFETSFKF